MSLTIKALLLFWPFLKRAVFGDRTIKEVVLANRHITVVSVCMFIAFIAFINTVIELSVIRSENEQLLQQLAQYCVVPDGKTLEARRKLLSDILK